MLIRIKSGYQITIGSPFFRYFPKLNYAYDKGETVHCGEVDIWVDFGDTLVAFLLTEVAYVVNTDTCDEHHMSLEQGKIIADYRSAPKSIENDTVLDDFVDLLKDIM